MNALVKPATLLLVCLMTGLSVSGFTLFNSNTGSDPYGSAFLVPAAEVDATPDADFSDCINHPADHWHWTIPASGPIVINYAYDPTFDTLFPSTAAGQATEAAIKAQIVLAMQQWSSAANAAYGRFDSYARGNSATSVSPLDGEIAYFAPFMDVRSATLHELGHILGLAHCDQGAAANPPANFAYAQLDPMTQAWNRGGGMAKGQLVTYNSMGQVAIEILNNYYPNTIAGGFCQPGTLGQEVMSQNSSGALFGNPPSSQPGRQTAEIYHILSWDELDGYSFVYGNHQVVFHEVPINSMPAPNLVFQAGTIMTGPRMSDSSAVCQGLPYGVSDGSGGIAIQSAVITFNSNLTIDGNPVQIGFEQGGYNFDVTAPVPVSQVTLNIAGTDNSSFLLQPNNTYNGWPDTFNTVTASYPNNPDAKDSIDVTWSNPSGPHVSLGQISAGTLFHVGALADVWDWFNNGYVTAYVNGNPQAQVPTVVSHLFNITAVNGFAESSAPDQRITGSCLTTLGATNKPNAVVIRMTSPMDGTRVSNLQLADVTGMGLTLSNLNHAGLVQLQQSNRLITVPGFGTNILNRGQQFAVVLAGSASYLPPDIVTNGHYLYLNQSNLLGRELFVAVTSSANGTTVGNYTLLNPPPTTAQNDPATGCTNTCIQFYNATNIVVATCASNCVPVFYDNVFAVDYCCSNGPVTLTFYPPSGSCFQPGTTPVTVVGTSACGYCNATNFTVTVACPSGQGSCTNSCISFYGVSNLVYSSCSCVPVYYSNIVAYDYCCSNSYVTLSYDPPPGTCFPPGTTTPVTVTGTSVCGRCNRTYFTVTVECPPTPCTNSCVYFYGISNLVFTSCSCVPLFYTNWISAGDYCCTSGSVALSFDPTNGTCFEPGTKTTVTVTGTSTCGHCNTATFDVTVYWNTNPPVISAPGDIVVRSCTNIPVYYDVTASSDYCTNVDVHAYPPSGHVFSPGTTTKVVCYAVDCCFNTSETSFNVTVLPSVSPCVAGLTWTAQNSTNATWYSIASSASGQYLAAAAYNGLIYTSPNYGATWTPRAGSGTRNWYCVASDASGQYLVGVVYGGQIYTSSDYGVTWTARDSNRNWYYAASSSSGQYLVAAVYGGAIYTSSNFGATWTPQASGSRNWYSVASDATGQYLVAVVYGGQIYTSSNYGVTWTPRDSNRNWISVASSSSGQYLGAAVYGGQIYTSPNFGATWTPQASGSRNWYSVASDATGQDLVAVVYGGQIYTSSDQGVTWMPRDSNRNWASVASSTDGSRLAAGVAGGPIYTSSCTPLAQCCVPPPTNMVMWLPFDETNGIISANLCSATNPGVQINHPLSWPGAYVANSLLFNGANYVTVQDYPSIEIGTNGLTIDAWVYHTPPANGWTNAAIVDKFAVAAGNGYGLYYLFGTNAPNELLFEASGAGYAVLNTPPISDNQWHFIAVTMNQSVTPPQGVFYVDGVVAGTFTPTRVNFSNTNALWVGASHLASFYPWTGGLDEVEVFNRALSANELFELYSANAAGKCKACCYLQVLTITNRETGTVQVNWGGCGTLEQTTNLITGPWTLIPNAPSPYLAPIPNAPRFYRTRCF
jgi:hypothetical protein